jgi:cysteine desulfurase/selenocysteine lyase
MIPYDVDLIRKDFPILAREVNGRPLVYLDNGASAQKPRCVIDAVTQAYSMEYANVHRGLHYLSNLATDRYEAVRGKIARFPNAGSEAEIVFTSGTTEGINLVSYGWAAPRLRAGLAFGVGGRESGGARAYWAWPSLVNHFSRSAL